MAEEDRPSVRGGLIGGERAAASDKTFEDLSASALQKYLGGINYPKNKREIIDYARGQDATPAVIEALNRFEDKEYRSAAEVSQEFGRIK